MKVNLKAKYDLEMDLRNFSQIFLYESTHSYGCTDEVSDFLKELPKEVTNIVRGEFSYDEKYSKF